MKLLLHFCAAMRPKAELPVKQKSVRLSSIRERSSGIYDDIGNVNTLIETDMSHQYDVIPDNDTSQPLPYQNLDPATREEPPVSHYTKPLHTADTNGNGSSDEKENDPSYTIALVELYNEGTSSPTSHKHKPVTKHDYLTLQPDDDGNDVEASAQKDSGDENGASTSISDLYAKVQKKKGYRRLEPHSRENPPPKDYTKLSACKQQSEDEQLSSERTALLEESTARNNNHGERDDEVIATFEYNHLNPHTKDTVVKEYTPLTEDKSGGGDSSQKEYHVLNPDTREPSKEKSAPSKVYTKLQQQGTVPSSDEVAYHGLDAATRDTRPRLPHEYATLSDK